MALLGVGPPGAAAPTAPVFRAAGSYSERGSGSPGNLTPSLPTNLAGDLFLCVGVGYLSDINTPSGWTEQFDTYSFGGLSNQHGYIFTRDARSTGGEAGSENFFVTDRGAAQIFSFSGVAGSSFYVTLASVESVSGTNTNPSLGITSNGLTMIASMGFTTAASITIGGSPSGGTYSVLSAAYGSTDIFAIHLQSAAGSVGTISGGTTTFGGVNDWEYIAFRLDG